MKIKLSKEQIDFCIDLGKKRHEAKHISFRRNSFSVSEEKRISDVPSEYLPHIIGVIGELAWSLYTGESVDENIYKVRDSGEDFKGVEIKTVTYNGSGEPELKIPVKDWESKTPNLYVLAKFDMVDTIELLGCIERKRFDEIKKRKKYGRFLPLNYVVKMSDLDGV